MEPELNTALFQRLRSLSVEHEFDLAVAFLPARPDMGVVDPAASEERRAWLKAFARDNGVAYIDLTETLSAHPTSDVHLEDDVHWSPRGHEVVAEALRPFLAKLLAKD